MGTAENKRIAVLLFRFFSRFFRLNCGQVRCFMQRRGRWLREKYCAVPVWRQSFCITIHFELLSNINIPPSLKSLNLFVFPYCLYLLFPPCREETCTIELLGVLGALHSLISRQTFARCCLTYIEKICNRSVLLSW